MAALVRAAPICNAQTIRDPGFEAISGYSWLTGPTTFGWSIDSGCAAVVNAGFGEPHSGRQVLVAPMIATAAVASVSQMIEGFVPGQSYRLTFFTKLYESPAFSNSVAPRVSIGSATSVFDDIDQKAAKGEWMARELEFLASRSSLRLQVFAQHPAFGGFFCFDDFSIQRATNNLDSSRFSDVIHPAAPAVVNPTVAQANVGIYFTASSPAVVFPALEICWLSEIGKTYQVQWTSRIDATNWTNLGEPARASEASTCVFDSTRHSGARFYRVIPGDH